MCLRTRYAPFGASDLYKEGFIMHDTFYQEVVTVPKNSKRKSRPIRLFSAATILLILTLSVACGSFKAGAPDSITGNWTCEEYASDGETNTGFYEMYIKKDGTFSLYDAGAGNPGISGKMGNGTDNTVECRFNTDDFDPPFCWDIDSSGDTFKYSAEGDSLKLTHNGITLSFRRKPEEDEELFIPEPIDSLISFTLPKEFKADMEYPYAGEDGNPTVEIAYTSDTKGYFAAGIFSYKGWDCLGDTNSTIDLDEYLDALKNPRQVNVGGKTGYYGTRESDDMPDMVAIVYVEHKDYVFEFRLTNSDEQVTKAQTEEFLKVLSTLEFKF